MTIRKPAILYLLGLGFVKFLVRLHNEDYALLNIVLQKFFMIMCNFLKTSYFFL